MIVAINYLWGMWSLAVLPTENLDDPNLFNYAYATNTITLQDYFFCRFKLT